jgi:asparagine synthase (glutamine-hydrolysing)
LCGIAAVLAYKGRTLKCDLASRVSSLNCAQRFRGPDGEGMWVSEDGRVGLGHRHLAIIYQSPAGAQPLANADGKLRITFNGEIYNYQELRYELERKGCTLFSASDTEVILNLLIFTG